MFLNDDQLCGLIRQGAIGNQYVDDEFDVEAGGVGLTCHKLFEVGSPNRRGCGGFIGKKWRKLAPQREIPPIDFKTIPVPIAESYGITREERETLIDTGTEFVWVIEQGVFYLIQTGETIHCPLECVGLLGERRTLIVAGAVLGTTFISPNFNGNLAFSLHHFGPSFLLEVDSTVVAYRLAEIKEGGAGYRGKVWKGDKMTTDGMEVGR